jgi:hypothetical protein
MTTASIQIASAILEQLGGRRFIALVGARTPVALKNGLAFKLPSYFAKNGINSVRITLDADDTYTVEFSKLRGLNITPISKHSGIYWDGLASLFTAETGLITTF